MINNKLSPCVMALGTFDGMHPGHRAVIRRAVEAARDMGAICRVYTFFENPRGAFAQAPRQLMTAFERERAMRDMGADDVVMARFTPELAAISPRDFISGLAREYAIRAVVAGEDYTFGSRAEGDALMLKRLGEELGFQTIIVPLVMVATTRGPGAEKVSSSRIRRELAANRADIAQALIAGEPVELNDE